MRMQHSKSAYEVLMSPAEIKLQQRVQAARGAADGICFWEQTYIYSIVCVWERKYTQGRCGRVYVPTEAGGGRPHAQDNEFLTRAADVAARPAGKLAESCLRVSDHVYMPY